MKEQELINDFVSGELSESETSELRAALEANPALKAELESVQNLRAGLAKHCKPVENPELWRACQDRLDAIDGTKRAESFVGRWQYGLAAGLFAVLLGIGMVQRNELGGRGVNASEVPALMSSAVGVGSAQADRQPTNSINLPLTDFRLLAAYEGLHNGTSFRLYDLQDQLGNLRLMVMPGHSKIEGLKPSFDGTYYSGTISNMPTLAWCKGDEAYMLMGRRDPIQLESAADIIRRNLEQ